MNLFLFSYHFFLDCIMMQILQEDNNFGCSSNYKVRQFQENNETSLTCTVPFSPLLLIDTLSRKSFSYNKVPQQPFKLTVLKLDDTYFEIEVAKNKTVCELKQAVEAAFSHLPPSGPGKVSWSHVWGHFCLSYNGCKLLKDDDYIGSYGIKDGDQLQFNRHTSINYNMARSLSERAGLNLDKRNLKQNGGNDQRYVGNIKCIEVHDKDGQDQGKEDKDDFDLIREDDHKDLITSRKFSLAHLFRGWLSYCKLKDTNMRIKQTRKSSKFTRSSVRSFKNIIRLYTNKV